MSKRSSPAEPGATTSAARDATRWSVLRARVAALGLLLAVIAASACGRRTPTQIMVRIDADPQVRAALRAVRVHVAREGGGVVLSNREFAIVRAPDAGGPAPSGRAFALPGEVGIVARDQNDRRRMTVVVTAVLDDDSTFDQTASVAFDTGRTVVLDMFLQNRCRPGAPGAYACVAAASCGRCGCTPLDRGTLPDYTPPDAASGGGDGGAVVDAGEPPPPGDAASGSCNALPPPPRPRGLFDLDEPDAAAASNPGTAGMFVNRQGCMDTDGRTRLDAGGTPAPDRAVYFVVRNATFGWPPLTEWQRVGYDRDGVCTDPARAGDPSAAPSCRTNNPAGTVTDGERGRDNAFGSVLGQAIQTSGVLTEESINRNIRNGKASVALRITGLSGPDDGEVMVEMLPVVGGHRPGQAYNRDQTEAALAWDGTDVWHVVNSIAYDAVNPLLSQARSFTAYTSHGVLVARLAPRSTIVFAQQTGFSARFPVSGAVLTGPVGCELSSLGPLEVSAWVPVTALRAELPSFGLCPEVSPIQYNIVSNFITQAADLYVAGDEVRQEPTLECNAISLGFRTQWIPMTRGCDALGPEFAPMTCPGRDGGALPDVVIPPDVRLPDGFSFDVRRD